MHPSVSRAVLGASLCGILTGGCATPASPTASEASAASERGPALTASGFSGVVMAVSGPRISGAKLTFVKEDCSVTRTVTSGNKGVYRIDLALGRYVVSAVHPDYEPYSSAPGFFVVSRSGYATGNFVLKKKRNPLPLTTVLLLRHAEKGPTQPDDRQTPLSPDGVQRAEELVHVAEKAGVTTLYATQYLRTQQTVQNLATRLGKPVRRVCDSDLQGLVAEILSQHAGEVVLIASHSPAVPMIVQAFGGTGGAVGDEFDNLFVLTVYDYGRAKVANLQYGRASP